MIETTRVEELARAGERDAARLIAAGKDEFPRERDVRLDYFEIVDPKTLDPIRDISEGALVAVAAYVGSTRLIDNLLLNQKQ